MVGVELLLIVYQDQVFHVITVEHLLLVLDQGKATAGVDSLLLLPREGKVKKDVESLLLALDQGQAMVGVEPLLLLPQIEVAVTSYNIRPRGKSRAPRDRYEER